jgi:hypothetical protein
MDTWDSPRSWSRTWASLPPAVEGSSNMSRPLFGWSCARVTFGRRSDGKRWERKTSSSDGSGRHQLSKWSQIIISWIYIMILFTRPAGAAFINFENCLDPNIVNSEPLQLQFMPLYFWAVFNSSAPSQNLNVTVYGNVSGIATREPLPGPNDPQWRNPNETKGKIVDISPANNKYSTLFAKFSVLSYTPYQAPPQRFCNASIHGECPLGPAFYANG